MEKRPKVNTTTIKLTLVRICQTLINSSLFFIFLCTAFIDCRSIDKKKQTDSHPHPERIVELDPMQPKFLIKENWISQCWSKVYQAPDQEVGALGNIFHKILLTSGNNFIAVGQANGGINGEEKAWILGLTKDGAVRWQKIFDKTGRGAGRAICQTVDSNYVVSGYITTFIRDGYSFDAWAIKLNNNGQILWEKII